MVMEKSLDREILRLSVPSIVANVTVPLVGMVDTAVAGHLPCTAPGAVSPATYIGAIAIGSMLFNLLYWGFGFLRTGTGGLTAQAFGARDIPEVGRIFCRGVILAMASALLILLLQRPFCSLSMHFVGGSAAVRDLAIRYFRIRIWAAPATLALMSLSGWFVGMQDTVSSMWKDLIVNVVNIAASVILSLGIGRWGGMGFDGIALGTVIAQYSGLAFCVAVSRFKYGPVVFSRMQKGDVREALRREDMRSYSRMNLDLFGRSIGFIMIYIGYTALATTLGDMLLACSSIMMQLLMLFSYFTDGFAYAGEALVGRSIGERDAEKLSRTVVRVFLWSFAVVGLFMLLYGVAGVPVLRLLTDDGDVVEECRAFLPWLLLMPPLGCAAFTWDGIYLGATASRQACWSMLGAAVCFFGVWYGGVSIFGLDGVGGMHLLMAAYFAHLLFRTVYLTATYRSSVLSRVR